MSTKPLYVTGRRTESFSQGRGRVLVDRVSGDYDTLADAAGEANVYMVIWTDSQKMRAPRQGDSLVVSWDGLAERVCAPVEKTYAQMADDRAHEEEVSMHRKRMGLR